MVHAEHTGTVVDVLPDVFHDRWGPQLIGALLPAPDTRQWFAPRLSAPAGPGQGL